MADTGLPQLCPRTLLGAFALVLIAACGGSEEGVPGGASGAPAAGTSGASTSGSGAGGSPASALGGGGATSVGSAGSPVAGGAGASVAGAGGANTAGASGVGGASASSGCTKVGKTGAFQAQMTAFGLERGYYLSVPATYSSAVPHRLVFGYHGSNYSGVRMRMYLDLEKAPLAERTIFVYPDGLPLEGQPDHIAWDLAADGRDIAFFDELYAKLASEYCIDRERIFVNGQSFGGLMTNAVGCLRGDVVRAIAVVAGSGPHRGAMCRGEVAVWLTHGMDDDAVQFSSGEASRDHWLQANGCDTTAVPGSPPACQSYQGCRAGQPVIWCPHVGDGGHQHPSFGRAAVREFMAQF